MCRLSNTQEFDPSIRKIKHLMCIQNCILWAHILELEAMDICHNWNVMKSKGLCHFNIGLILSLNNLNANWWESYKAYYDMQVR